MCSVSLAPAVKIAHFFSRPPGWWQRNPWRSALTAHRPRRALVPLCRPPDVAAAGASPRLPVRRIGLDPIILLRYLGIEVLGWMVPAALTRLSRVVVACALDASASTAAKASAPTAHKRHTWQWAPGSGLGCSFVQRRRLAGGSTSPSAPPGSPSSDSQDRRSSSPASPPSPCVTRTGPPRATAPAAQSGPPSEAR